MIKQEAIIIGVILFGLGLSGCRTTYDAHRTPQAEMENEGTIVFVRPDRHTLLGTRSIRDYIEVTYEEMSANAAGYPTLRVGLRNRGGQRYYDRKGPDVQLSIQAAFYNQPTESGGAAAQSPAYKSNWQTVKLVRGQTSEYQVSCPVKGAQYYQVTISEYLK